jgi:hypothetical protein
MPSRHKRFPLSVRLPEAEEARLRARAAEMGLAIGPLVADAVREKLDRLDAERGPLEIPA